MWISIAIREDETAIVLLQEVIFGINKISKRKTSEFPHSFEDPMQPISWA